MMKKATLLRIEWLHIGLCSIIIGLMFSFTSNANSLTSAMNMEDNFMLQQQKTELLSQLYVSKSDSENLRVSINVDNKPLIDILHKLAEELNVGISINTQVIDDTFITYNEQDVLIYDALHDLLEGTGLNVMLSEDQKTLILFEEEKKISDEEEVFQGSISGQVTDSENGDPLIGVNVVIPSLNIGDATGSDGTYLLSDIPEGEYRIEARYIGYDTVRRIITVTSGEETIVNFEMTASTSELDELVVTALGITRDERSIGYSTQSVSSENLSYANEKNVIGSLAGKIAGVQVVGASGASMGGTQKIKIRGVNSIGAGDEPLIVVDGTPISNANYSGSTGRDYGNLAQDINPDDVESINVLKGPAASALYGIRGQYGVIMITTKKGSKGSDRFTVDLSTSFTMDRVGNIMPYQNLYGAGSMSTFPTLPNGDPYVQTNYDESWGPRMDGTPVRHFDSFYPQDPEYGQLRPFIPQPDNIKDFFETGSNLSQGVVISGGSDNTRLRISFNNTNISGVEPNTYLNRNNVGVSAGVDLSEKWNVSTNLTFATNSARRPAQGVQAGSRYFGQWFQRNLDINRLKDYQYDDGTIKHWNLTSIRDANGDVGHFRPLYFNNPYFDAYENTYEDGRDRLFGDIGFSYNALPSLAISGFIRGDMFTQNLESRRAFGGTGTPFYSVGKYQNKEMNYELLAQYEQRWSEFSVDATVGANFYDRNYTYVSQSTSGGLTTPGFYNIDASVDRPNTNSYMLEKQVLSAYGLVSLGYLDTYYVDLSIRNDKSSALPESDNSYWYPSVSSSIVFSELVDWDQLTLGKVRASYAQAGSDLSPYRTTPYFIVGTEYGSINTLAIPSTLNNPNIKPAFAHSYEAGFDLRFFDRIGVAFTYYHQKNENQIINLDVSGTSGYGAAAINAGLIENKGIELSLNGQPIQTQTFSWDATINFNRNRNQVVELYEGIDVYGYSSTTYSGVTTYLNSYEGEPFGSIVGRGYQRDEATGQILLDDNNLPLYTDGTTNFGSALPDFTGGFQNVFNYRNFEFAAMIDFQVGGQFFSRSQSLADRTGLSKKTAEMNDRGSNVRDPIAEGGGVKVTGISASTGQEVEAYVNPRSYYGRLGRYIAEEYIYDSSYIKMREMRLGYNLGSEILERLPFSRVNVSLTAKNPFMIWQDAPKGLDPSELSTGSMAISWYESGQLNTVRSYGIDINLSF
ncbi:SusC/RagA family TonB-linked outer membrane protein [Rhodohalobacter halophilus]|uniref:SusC/RagA family TonB-linked outer membrane protein n=1 Tax=Rhodohalobacter halophilus TaxID=1812810 RepID=UPI000B20D5BF|nr:SusC/RagA family TonB-linked outer membrane protein [Rhodohalobacter halophilus]